MKIDANSVTEYMDKAGERGKDVAKLDAFIHKHAPDVNPVGDSGIFSHMLAYGMMPYHTERYKEWPVIMIGLQKNYISLYVCMVDEDGNYIAEKYEKDLGRVSCGKSCIRFKKYEDLNEETLRKILKDLNKKYKSGEKLYSK